MLQNMIVQFLIYTYCLYVLVRGTVPFILFPIFVGDLTRARTLEVIGAIPPQTQERCVMKISVFEVQSY